jgi:hypothetical protein
MDTRSDFQQRIGVGEPSRAFSLRYGTSDTRPVVADDGSLRGRVVGSHTHHWDGRVDATAVAPAVHQTIQKKETT